EGHSEREREEQKEKAQRQAMKAARIALAHRMRLVRARASCDPKATYYRQLTTYCKLGRLAAQEQLNTAMAQVVAAAAETIQGPAPQGTVEATLPKGNPATACYLESVQHLKAHRPEQAYLLLGQALEIMSNANVDTTEKQLRFSPPQQVFIIKRMITIAGSLGRHSAVPLLLLQALEVIWDRPEVFGRLEEPVILGRLGSSYLRTKRSQEAYQSFKAMQELAPLVPQSSVEAGILWMAKYGAATALFRLGRMEEAMQMSQAAIDVAEQADCAMTLPDSLGVMGRICHSIGGLKLQQAQELHQQQVALLTSLLTAPPESWRRWVGDNRRGSVRDALIEATLDLAVSLASNGSYQKAFKILNQRLEIIQGPKEDDSQFARKARAEQLAFTLHWMGRVKAMVLLGLDLSCAVSFLPVNLYPHLCPSSVSLFDSLLTGGQLWEASGIGQFLQTLRASRRTGGGSRGPAAQIQASSKEVITFLERQLHVMDCLDGPGARDAKDGKLLAIDEIKAQALHFLSCLHLLCGEEQAALERLEQAVSLGSEVGSSSVRADAYGAIGRVHMYSGNLAAAGKAFAKQLGEPKDAVSSRSAAACHSFRGWVMIALDRLAPALEDFQSQYELAKRHGDKACSTAANMCIAHVHANSAAKMAQANANAPAGGKVQGGSLSQARAFYAAYADWAEKSGDKKSKSHALMCLSIVADPVPGRSNNPIMHLKKSAELYREDGDVLRQGVVNAQ
ncbi:unnamed protein product, partial [Chrysoparadoxa australica]